jgi:hypothetical protein
VVVKEAQMMEMFKILNFKKEEQNEEENF